MICSKYSVKTHKNTRSELGTVYTMSSYSFIVQGHRHKWCFFGSCHLRSSKILLYISVVNYFWWTWCPYYYRWVIWKREDKSPSTLFLTKAQNLHICRSKGKKQQDSREEPDLSQDGHPNSYCCTGQSCRALPCDLLRLHVRSVYAAYSQFPCISCFSNTNDGT